MSSTNPLIKIQINKWIYFAMIGLFLFSLEFKFYSRTVKNIPINDYVTESISGLSSGQSLTVKSILQYANHGEYLVVWAWSCDLYVKAQLPQGVAENHTIRCILEEPLRSVYRQRYMLNLYRNKPPIFIDAVGNQSGYVLTNRATQGHEMFTLLREYVAQNYQLVNIVEGNRIYIRKDRLKKLVD